MFGHLLTCPVHVVTKRENAIALGKQPSRAACLMGKLEFKSFSSLDNRSAFGVYLNS